MMVKTLTSESVSEGHPDKFADQISDSVLDACLAEDPHTRAGVETTVKSNVVFVAGELTTTAKLDVAEIVNSTVERIGYTPEAHLDSFMTEPGALQLFTCLVKQSPDIALGVDGDGLDDQGAGDQGMMFGYACRESSTLMPAPIHLAHLLTKATTDARVGGLVPGLRPDSKSMVTVAYDSDGMPHEITDVLISVQHDGDVDLTELRERMLEQVVRPALPEEMLSDGVRFLLNPTGAFVRGGPFADTGLTGRKIIVDTYGGAARHGGGAFSGKDPSKVDRSAAYAARWVAKHVVASGAADRCEVQLSYAIGVAAPIAVDIETFGTSTVDPAHLGKVVHDLFDLRPAAIIRDLDLRRPIYRDTAAYGHFGRLDVEFPWEQTSRLDELKDALGL